MHGLLLHDEAGSAGRPRPAERARQRCVHCYFLAVKADLVTHSGRGRATRRHCTKQLPDLRYPAPSERPLQPNHTAVDE
jgi:hypothetical protein